MALTPMHTQIANRKRAFRHAYTKASASLLSVMLPATAAIGYLGGNLDRFFEKHPLVGGSFILYWALLGLHTLAKSADAYSNVDTNFPKPAHRIETEE